MNRFSFAEKFVFLHMNFKNRPPFWFFFRSFDFPFRKISLLFQAFFQGKLKIKGNMGLAMKLKELKMPEGAAVPATSSAGSGPKPGSEFKVASVFDQISAELNRVRRTL